MNVYKEIKTGLEQAIAYEKQSITDKEIKKALECCEESEFCRDCPCIENNLPCPTNKEIIDLINRKDEEINRLEAKNERLTADLKTTENIIKNTFLEKAGFDIDPLAEIKAEARKEFAERVKELLGVKKFGLIDNLLKEMESD